MDSATWDFICDNSHGQSMSQRVPNPGFFDAFLDEHGYFTSNTLYPSVITDPWMVTKEENSTLASLDGLHSGVPTRTTPTLTPTTLRTIEQTFLELTSESSYSREPGFVPPLVEPSQPTPAQTQNNCVSVAPQHNNILLESHQSQPPAKRNMGGRRPNRMIGMSVEEEQRRQIRRERNKMAAARCRKRRIDQTNALLEETEGLEKQRQILRMEIEDLTKSRKDLQILLESHRPMCKLRNSSPPSPPDIKPVIKSDLVINDRYVEVEKRDCEIGNRITRQGCNLAIGGFDNPNRPNTLSIFSEPKPRPDSLQLKTVETPAFMKTSNEVAGIPITTPSTGIGFNFDSLMEGGTGLTPVSTPLIPTCTSQKHNNQHNLSAVDLSSPDANPPRLVNL